MRYWLLAILCVTFGSQCAEAEVPARLAPISLQGQPFEGVTYYRLVGGRKAKAERLLPRPLVIHILEIDPQAPGVSFFTTPDNGDAPNEFTREVTSKFLTKYHMNIAINGDFFNAESGNTTDARGLAVSKGKVGSVPATGEKTYPALTISEDKKLQIVRPTEVPEGIWSAVSGGPVLLVDGQKGTFPAKDETHPRTAIGIDTDTNHLLILVVDGRQPGFSEGMYLNEVADLLLEFGVEQAMNLDGGGSTTLVFSEGKEGARVVNSPSDGSTAWTSGWERAVANHLGVVAKPNKDFKPLPAASRQKQDQEKKPATKPGDTHGAKPEAKPETKPEASPEVKPEAPPEDKPQPEPEAPSTGKPEAMREPEVQPQEQPEEQPEPPSTK